MNIDLKSPEDVLRENWDKLFSALQKVESDMQRLGMELPNGGITQIHKIPSRDASLMPTVIDAVRETALSQAGNITKQSVMDDLERKYPQGSYSGSSVSSALARLADDEIIDVVVRGGRGRASVYKAPFENDDQFDLSS